VALAAKESKLMRPNAPSRSPRRAVSHHCGARDQDSAAVPARRRRAASRRGAVQQRR
jgi:hypothetical protein